MHGQIELDAVTTIDAQSVEQNMRQASVIISPIAMLFIAQSTTNDSGHDAAEVHMAPT